MPHYGRMMNFLRLQQISSGCWPLAKVDDAPDNLLRLYRRYANAVTIIYTVKVAMEGVHIATHSENMFDKAAILIVFVCGCEYQLRMMYFAIRGNYYANMLVRYRDRIDLMAGGEMAQREEAVKELNRAQSESFKIIVTMTALFAVGFPTFYGIPVAVNWYRGAFDSSKGIPKQLPFAISVPFDVKHDPLNYWLTYAAELFLGYVCMGSLIVQDVMVCCFVVNLIGRLRLVKASLETLTSDSGDCDETIVYERLRRCIRHYGLVIGFTKELQNLYGFLFLVNFLCDAICICLLGFQMTSPSIENVIKFGIFLFGEILRLFLLSIYGNQLTEMNNDVTNAIYSCEWIPLTKRCKRTLIFFLMRSQNPLKLTAMGFANVSLETMALILKVSFQYFTILRTFEDNTVVN